ncbi:MAG: dihydrofolate reductase family protein [Candidatus Yanofskybacteria bacterium]|nr:dihydrofolate reductase family protein [Candidatus Yanofskybacteria bacterium]
MHRPETTLFLLTSVDGKISTGDTDALDVDRDYPNIPGLKEGLQQYYDIERTTDLFSLNTGRVFAKIGMNEKTDEPEKSPVHFVIIDNHPHLTERGIRYLEKKATEVIIATTNEAHPAVAMQKEASSLHVITYRNHIDLADLFQRLKLDYGAERLTIQSGGTLNTTLVRDGLIDRVLLVVAPALIGGKNTASLMDGESLHTPEELSKIKTLELVQAKPLEHSYLLLEYRVKQ